MVVNVDHYATLQVNPRAGRDAIRAAYRTLARRYHPDLVGGSEAQMAALNNAWAVLRDPKARAEYDRARLASTQGPSPTGNDGAGVWPTPARTGQPPGSVLDYGRYAGWSLRELARH
ncbi:MAG: J domain-containing protein, partial [Candidatus Limnocylindrales bacterium]